MKLLAQIKKLSLATMLFALVSGVLFVAFPDKCIKYVSLTVGAAFIAAAIVAVIGYLIDKTSVFSLGTGVVLGVVGIIICMFYKQVLSFIVIMIGIFVLIAGILNLITGLRTLPKSKLFGLITLVLSLVTIAFGIFAVTRSGELTEALVRILGIGLIIYALVDLIAFIEIRLILRDIRKNSDIPPSDASTGDEIVTEGTIVE